MSLTIRSAVKTDAEQIGTVHYRAWIETYAGMLPESYLAALSAEKSIKIFSKTECRNIVVAEVDGEIVGFCGWGEFRDLKQKNMGEIQGIYILDAYKRRHIGLKMMEYTFVQLKNHGYQKAGLWVLNKNDIAIAFYEKLGFAYGGSCKQVDLGENVTELLYIKDI